MKRCADYLGRYPSWNDWKWQCANRITTAAEAAQFLNMTEAEKADVGKCLSSFRMAITPYYASLIDPNDPNDPIRKICVPSIEETLPCETTWRTRSPRSATAPCRISYTGTPTGCC